MRSRGASILNTLALVLFALGILVGNINTSLAQTPVVGPPDTPLPGGQPPPSIPGGSIPLVPPSLPSLPNLPSVPGLGASDAGEKVNITANINCSLPGCREIANEGTIREVNKNFQDERLKLEEYLASDAYKGEIHGALQKLTEQWTTGEISLVQMVSNLIDAGLMADTINRARQLNLREALELEPDEGYCAAVTTQSPLVAVTSSTRDLGETISNQSQISDSSGNIGEGGSIDYNKRQEENYLSLFCNPNDFNGALGEMCRGKNPGADTDWNKALQTIVNPLSGDGNTVLTSYINNLSGYTPTQVPEDLRANTDEYRKLVAEQMPTITSLESTVRNSFSNVLAAYAPGQTQIDEFVQANFNRAGVDSQNGTPGFMRMLEANVRQSISPDTLAGETMVPERALHSRKTSNDALNLSIKMQRYESLKREVRSMSAAVGGMIKENSTDARQNLINAATGEDIL